MHASVFVAFDVLQPSNALFAECPYSHVGLVVDLGAFSFIMFLTATRIPAIFVEVVAATVFARFRFCAFPEAVYATAVLGGVELMLWRSLQGCCLSSCFRLSPSSCSLSFQVRLGRGWPRYWSL